MFSENECEENQLTVGEWLHAWYETYARPALAPKTCRSYLSAVKLFCRECPEQGTLSLDKLTEAEVQKQFNILGYRYSKSQLNTLRVVLRRAYAAAVRNNVCRINPIGQISLPRYAPQHVVTSLTVKDQQLVEKAASYTLNGHLALFLLETGLRGFELCNLEWTDYSPKDQYIKIRRSKSEAGIRIVPLTPKALDIIERQTKINKYIFNSSSGSQVTESVLKRLYQRLRKETGVNYLTTHVYRHSFATRKLEQGMESKALSTILGHTDEHFTLNRYCTAEVQYLRQQMNKQKQIPSTANGNVVVLQLEDYNRLLMLASWNVQLGKATG